MNLQDFLHLVRRSWILLVVGAVVGALAGAAWTSLRTPTYTATANVYVSTGPADTLSDLNQSSSYAQQVVKGFARVATTGYVLQQVIEELGLQTTPALLAERVTATADTDTTLIAIDAQDASAARAAIIANAVAQKLSTAVDQLSPSSSTSTAIRITQLDQAVAPSAPSGISPTVGILAGLVAGLGLALVIALLAERLSTKVRSVAELRSTVDSTVIGTLLDDEGARAGRLLMRDAPRSPAAESVRSLRANLAFLRFPEESRAIVVTSSLDGEGKSTAAVELAIALSDARNSVLLVDGDLRRPRVAERLGLDGSIGLSDLLIDRVALRDAVQPYGTRGLAVLPAGAVPPNPSELLVSDRMRPLLAELRRRYQYIVIDAPPVLPVSDAVILAEATDGAVVVCEIGSTRKTQVLATLQALRAADARVLGVVANRVPLKGADAERDALQGYGLGSVASA